MENRIKVVLADANENFRTMLQQTIENTGEFDVVGSAGDGAEAWKMIERERPQLVITDVILPELDGFALLDRMAKLPARPKTILVSAFYREQPVQHDPERGAELIREVVGDQEVELLVLLPARCSSGCVRPSGTGRRRRKAPSRWNAL